jgi:hypothetical protein
LAQDHFTMREHERVKLTDVPPAPIASIACRRFHQVVEELLRRGGLGGARRIRRHRQHDGGRSGGKRRQYVPAPSASASRTARSRWPHGRRDGAIRVRIPNGPAPIGKRPSAGVRNGAAPPVNVAVGLERGAWLVTGGIRVRIWTGPAPIGNWTSLGPGAQRHRAGGGTGPEATDAGTRERAGARRYESGAGQ